MRWRLLPPDHPERPTPDPDVSSWRWALWAMGRFAESRPIEWLVVPVLGVLATAALREQLGISDVLATVLAIGVASLGVLGLIFVTELILAPYGQRNAAVERMRGLEAERLERLTPEFHLDLAYQPHPGPIGIGKPPQIFQANQTLWVEVHNDGPDGKFSGFIRNAIGTGDSHYDVDEVAWEHTIDRHYKITRGNRARLRVANVSQDPDAFWMWTARSATWSPSGHAAGHRRTDFEEIIEFDLTVTNSTAGKSRTARLRVTFDDKRQVNGFVFADSSETDA